MIIFLSIILLLVVVAVSYVVLSKVFSKSSLVFKLSDTFTSKDLIILGSAGIIQLLCITTLILL